MASTQGFEPGQHWWAASALITAPPLLPLFPFSLIINSSPIPFDACAHCCSEEARESGIYKANIASRILSGMEKETALREETSTSGSKNDEEERIVDSETSSRSSREQSDISDSPVYCMQWSSTSRNGRMRTRVV